MCLALCAVSDMLLCMTLGIVYYKTICGHRFCWGGLIARLRLNTIQ